MTSLFTIGADPEFFLKREGKHVSAIGIIGGSKTNPRLMEREGFGLLEDNVAVEFNIAPAHNHEQFIEHIHYVMQSLRDELPPIFEFSHESAVLFDNEELQHPQAQEFGCEPDYNAWTRKMNPRPCAADQTLRSAGGHIHVGVEGVDAAEFIRAMDVYVGVPATKLDKHGKMRRQLYGKHGCYRPKPYGAEYRTLSNFWIFDDSLIKWAYDQTQKAVEFIKSGKTIPDNVEAAVRDVINDDNEKAYEYLLSTYRFA